MFGLSRCSTVFQTVSGVAVRSYPLFGAGPAGPRRTLTSAFKERQAQRQEAQAELTKYLYGHKPAPTVPEEYANGQVVSDAELPTPAMPLHKSGFRWFKNPLYTAEQVQSVKITHRPPMTFQDRVALSGVSVMRTAFDKLTGYPNLNSQGAWLDRILFLETVAGVPGFVAGMSRHLRSLRRLQRDQGWIHTLLEEAENERMHLLTFMNLKQPGILFRLAVLLTQGVFANGFILVYLLRPQLCHRFVGYLEEEAVRTYTHCLQVIDTPGSPLHEWTWAPAPEIAIEYWRLAPTATMRDVIEVVRADEACHRHVNHVFSSIDYDKRNPFGPSGMPELAVAPCEKVQAPAPESPQLARP